jgi:cyclopropane fatty-acyl-phospholipid synthase-like methyltransferase
MRLIAPISKDDIMNSNWYKTFFHGVALELWRRAATPEMTREEVDYLLSELNAPPGANLLDVPCGNGRHSLEMASRGFRVTGCDISSDFITEATAAAASKGLAATFHERDMREIPSGESFDGGWCLGNSFGYLTHEGTRQFLKSVATTLRTGARFILETRMSAECFLPKFQQKREMLVGDIEVTVHNSYDATQSRLSTDYIFEHAGKSETHSSVHQIYTAGEIRRLLAESGLETIVVHGSTGGEPFTLNSPDAVFVTQRN